MQAFYRGGGRPGASSVGKAAAGLPACELARTATSRVHGRPGHAAGCCGSMAAGALFIITICKAIGVDVQNLHLHVGLQAGQDDGSCFTRPMTEEELAQQSRAVAAVS